MSAETGWLLWRTVECGASLTIAAEPSGAGKTTVLTGLLDAIPDHRQRRFVRGIHEQFLDLPVDPNNLSLLVNEISPHLPIYAWGPVVGRLLGLASQGAQLLATVHALRIDDIVGQLAGPPLHIPLESIASLGAVAFLDAPSDATSIGRVRSVQTLSFDSATGGLNVAEAAR
jgi:type IV secretory pathway ATPase VirB11/archaellum biosynthesis ATPase